MAPTPDVVNVAEHVDLGVMDMEVGGLAFDENTTKDLTDQFKLDELLKRKKRVPLDLLNKKSRILKVEQEGTIASNLFCPSSYRPYDAYAVSSNSVFELARIERSLDCNKTLLLPEIQIYKT